MVLLRNVILSTRGTVNAFAIHSGERTAASIFWAKSNYMVTAMDRQSGERKEEIRMRDRMSSFLACVSQSFKTRKDTVEVWKLDIQSACAQTSALPLPISMISKLLYQCTREARTKYHKVDGFNNKDVFARGPGD